MKPISITSVPHHQQRYNTTGDYFENNGVLEIRVSEFNDDRYEFLVALHELVESYLCAKRKINEEAIDNFDINYEKKRPIDDPYSEPGDQADAPYHQEHMFATKLERVMAEELQVDWDDYTKACVELTAEYQKRSRDH